MPFYQALFGWTVTLTAPATWDIHNSAQEHVATLMEIPNRYKGKYEYWVCTFGVPALEPARQAVLSNGGSEVVDEEERVLMTDHSGQAFFYLQAV